MAAFSRSAGWALERYLRRIAPAVCLEGTDEAEAAWQTLRGDCPNRRFLLYYWTEAGLPLMLYGFRRDGLLGRDLAFVHDETLGGRVTADVLRRLGRDRLALRHRRPGTLARDVGKLARATAPIGMAVDGRGPYGHVGAPFARLARQAEVIAVPLGVRVRHASKLRLAGPVALPRRGTEITFSLGRPIDCRLAGDDLRGRLQAELDSASASESMRRGVSRVATAGG